MGKLESLRAALGVDAGKGPKKSSGVSGSKAKEEEDSGEGNEEGICATQDVLDLEIPTTPGKDGRSLLDAALQVSPVPARSRTSKLPWA